MTQDEIIELAVKAGFFDWEVVQQFETFAKLVEERAAAKEREACARLLDDAKGTGRIASCREAANAIRARGQA